MEGEEFVRQAASGGFMMSPAEARLRDPTARLEATRDLIDNLPLVETEQEARSLARLLAARGARAPDISRRLFELIPLLPVSIARELICVLPRLVVDSPDELDGFVQCARSLMAADRTLLMPAIGALAEAPLSERHKLELIKLTLGALPLVDESDLPALIRAIMGSLSLGVGSRVLRAMRSRLGQISAGTTSLLLQIICQTLRLNGRVARSLIRTYSSDNQPLSRWDCSLLLHLLHLPRHGRAAAAAIAAGIRHGTLHLELLCQCISALDESPTVSSHVTVLIERLLCESGDASTSVPLVVLSAFSLSSANRRGLLSSVLSGIIPNTTKGRFENGRHNSSSLRKGAGARTLNLLSSKVPLLLSEHWPLLHESLLAAPLQHATESSRPELDGDSTLGALCAALAVSACEQSRLRTALLIFVQKHLFKSSTSIDLSKAQTVTDMSSMNVALHVVAALFNSDSLPREECEILCEWILRAAPLARSSSAVIVWTIIRRTMSKMPKHLIRHLQENILPQALASAGLPHLYNLTTSSDTTPIDDKGEDEKPPLRAFSDANEAIAAGYIWIPSISALVVHDQAAIQFAAAVLRCAIEAFDADAKMQSRMVACPSFMQFKQMNFGIQGVDALTANLISCIVVNGGIDMYEYEKCERHNKSDGGYDGNHDATHESSHMGGLHETKGLTLRRLARVAMHATCADCLSGQILHSLYFQKKQDEMMGGKSGSVRLHEAVCILRRRVVLRLISETCGKVFKRNAQNTFTDETNLVAAEMVWKELSSLQKLVRAYHAPLSLSARALLALVPESMEIFINLYGQGGCNSPVVDSILRRELAREIYEQLLEQKSNPHRELEQRSNFAVNKMENNLDSSKVLIQDDDCNAAEELATLIPLCINVSARLSNLSVSVRRSGVVQSQGVVHHKDVLVADQETLILIYNCIATILQIARTYVDAKWHSNAHRSWAQILQSQLECCVDPHAASALVYAYSQLDLDLQCPTKGAHFSPSSTQILLPSPYEVSLEALTAIYTFHHVDFTHLLPPIDTPSLGIMGVSKSAMVAQRCAAGRRHAPLLWLANVAISLSLPAERLNVCRALLGECRRCGDGSKRGRCVALVELGAVPPLVSLLLARVAEAMLVSPPTPLNLIEVLRELSHAAVLATSIMEFILSWPALNSWSSARHSVGAIVVAVNAIAHHAKVCLNKCAIARSMQGSQVDRTHLDSPLTTIRCMCVKLRGLVKWMRGSKAGAEESREAINRSPSEATSIVGESHTETISPQAKSRGGVVNSRRTARARDKGEKSKRGDFASESVAREVKQLPRLLLRLEQLENAVEEVCRENDATAYGVGEPEYAAWCASSRSGVVPLLECLRRAQSNKVSSPEDYEESRSDVSGDGDDTFGSIRVQVSGSKNTHAFPGQEESGDDENDLEDGYSYSSELYASDCEMDITSEVHDNSQIDDEECERARTSAFLSDKRAALHIDAGPNGFGETVTVSFGSQTGDARVN